MVHITQIPERARGPGWPKQSEGDLGKEDGKAG